MKSTYRLQNIFGHLVKKGESSPVRTNDLEEAEGVVFICPKCLRDFGHPAQSHTIYAWFENREVSGDTISNVTVGGTFRVGSCGWSGRVEDGSVHSIDG